MLSLVKYKQNIKSKTQRNKVPLKIKLICLIQQTMPRNKIMVRDFFCKLNCSTTSRIGTPPKKKTIWPQKGGSQQKSEREVFFMSLQNLFNNRIRKCTKKSVLKYHNQKWIPHVVIVVNLFVPFCFKNISNDE